MKKTAARGLSLSWLPILGVLVAFLVFFSVFAKNFLSVRSLLNLLVQTSSFCILGIGSALVLIVGGIDFSLGAVVALSGTAAAWLAAMGTPIWLAFLWAILIGGAIGCANGFLVAKLRLPSFITTFAMSIFLRGSLGFTMSHVRWRPIPEALGDLANAGVFRVFARDAGGARAMVFPGLSWMVLIMAAVALLFHFLLAFTRIGRYAYLIGSNPAAARFSGIKVDRVKISAYATAGLLAGLVGVLLASRMVAPPGAAAGYEFIGITSAMVGGASLAGGVGGVGGTVIGSFILSTISMGLTMMNANGVYVPLLLDGIVILGAVYLDQAKVKK